MNKMRHIFYVLLFLICFNILYSLNINKLNLKYNDKDFETYKNILNHKDVWNRKNWRHHELSKNSKGIKSPKRRRAKDSDSSDVSSSVEKMNWKDEWREHLLQKKLEALNSSVPEGDVVNMVAARPWGVPCGDPNQHDMPWGTCMLPMECEAEYRIYRGDYFCGRTTFVCCALQLTNYDLNVGFDASLADSNFESGSEEKKHVGKKEIAERKRRQRKRERKRRRQERHERKERIKKVIRSIVEKIQKILVKSFRNGTVAGNEKTANLKRFIKHLKKKYLYDRKLVRDIHEADVIKSNKDLEKRLKQIGDVNQEFVKNETYRNIIVNGTIDKHNLSLLMKAYPELEELVNSRRSAGKPDYLEYDVEYGYIYD